MTVKYKTKFSTNYLNILRNYSICTKIIVLPTNIFIFLLFEIYRIYTHLMKCTYFSIYVQEL